MVKLIIFDWDDVFTTGSTNGYFKCYHKAITAVGVNLSAEEEARRIKAKWGKTAREEISELLKEKPELVDKAESIYEQTLMGNTFVDCLSLTKGSDLLLEKLSKKYKLAVASGINPRLLKERVFSKFGIKNVFSEIMTVYDITDPNHAKPHPFLLLEIMKKLNIPSNDTVMVGDAKGDVYMARSANVTPIVVLSGHLNHKEAEDLNVRYIIPDVTYLEEVLEKINYT